MNLINKVINWYKTTKRPWGYYIVHEDYPHHKMKTLVLKPGKSISLQRHSHRDEWWFIVSGKGLMIRDGHRTQLYGGGTDAYNIPAMQWHKLTNESETEDLVVFEMQLGRRCVEQDIERWPVDVPFKAYPMPATTKKKD